MNNLGIYRIFLNVLIGRENTLYRFLNIFIISIVIIQIIKQCTYLRLLSDFVVGVFAWYFIG